jgi:pimeloyl-ACP methyl ester carboxylesterase
MRHIRNSVLRLGIVAAMLVAAAAPGTAAAPIDQAGWAARKQSVRLGNGMDLAYVEFGNPTGTPVVLLHGYTDTSRVWSIVAPYLAHHRLLIPDQRGHGASSKPECCYALADFAYDLKLFLDAKRIRRAALVGSSMGSMVAQLFAAEYPDRTSAIVLAGSTALAPLQRDLPLWSTLTSTRTPANQNAQFLKEWSPAASPTLVDAELIRHFDAEMAAIPTHVWRGVIRELTGVPVGRHAADVRAPVLILSGGKDPLFGPEHHQALLRAYPAAEAHVLADLGHNLVVERPEQVAPLLRAFLTRHAGATAR